MPRLLAGQEEVASSDVVALVFNFGPVPVLPRHASPSIWRKLRGNGYLYEAHEFCFISPACRRHALIPSASPSHTPLSVAHSLRSTPSVARSLAVPHVPRFILSSCMQAMSLLATTGHATHPAADAGISALVQAPSRKHLCAPYTS